MPRVRRVSQVSSASLNYDEHFHCRRAGTCHLECFGEGNVPASWVFFVRICILLSLSLWSHRKPELGLVLLPVSERWLVLWRRRRGCEASHTVVLRQEGIDDLGMAPVGQRTRWVTSPNKAAGRGCSVLESPASIHELGPENGANRSTKLRSGGQNLSACAREPPARSLPATVAGPAELSVAVVSGCPGRVAASAVTSSPRARPGRLRASTEAVAECGFRSLELEVGSLPVGSLCVIFKLRTVALPVDRRDY